MKLDVSNLVLSGNVITNMIEVVDFTMFVTGRVYTFGDFAIWTDGVLYGSSQGNGSYASQFFFKYDILNGTYYDNYNGAKNYQLAFGFDGTLFGIQYSAGTYVEINLTDGSIASELPFAGGLSTIDMASGFYNPMTSREETAWGNGTPFVNDSGSWATYFGFTITGFSMPDPNDPNATWEANTAWAGDTMGGGAAWWYYFDVALGNPQSIYAGQNLAGGATSVSYIGGKIIIDLDPAYIKFDINKLDNLKIQGYDGSVPSARPSAGLFTTYKGTYTDSDTHIEISVPAYDYYAIHIDVITKN
jgi:hypothetical protein